MLDDLFHLQELIKCMIYQPIAVFLPEHDLHVAFDFRLVQEAHRLHMLLDLGWSLPALNFPRITEHREKTRSRGVASQCHRVNVGLTSDSDRSG